MHYDMFAGTLLALDMGGYPLAQAMTDNQDIVILSGIILGSMLGCTIVFSNPVAIGIVQEEDKAALSQGMMLGIIAIPFGTFAGGITAGIDAGTVLINLIPSLLAAGLLTLGLWLIPGMDPIGPQLEIIGVIAITLAGAYPLVHFITSTMSGMLGKAGKMLRVNEVAVAGMIASLANSIPTFGMLKDMDYRGVLQCYF